MDIKILIVITITLMMSSFFNIARAERDRNNYELPDPSVPKPVPRPQSGPIVDPWANALLGFADLHVHQFSNLAFNGRMVHGNAFGPIDQALSTCEGLHGMNGRDPRIPEMLEFPNCAICEKAPWLVSKLKGLDCNVINRTDLSFMHQDVLSQLFKNEVQKRLATHRPGNRFEAWPRWNTHVTIK